MSRIDDAFRRITGAEAEPRQPSNVERFASEGKAAKVHDREDYGRTSRSDEARVRNLVAVSSEPADTRPAATHTPEPVADTDAAAEVDRLIDVQQIGNYIGFTFRSLNRHKVLALITFAMAMAMTIAGVTLMPKTYHIQTKLLAQRNAVMTALSNPGRAVPWDADAPTRAAAETVLRRDNLLALMKQTDLVNEWERKREPILRLKDWLVAVVLQAHDTPAEKVDGLVGLLESSMRVEAGPVGDGTVTIELLWRDPEMGYRLVQGAQKAFLDARQMAEKTAISESIAILERYSGSLNSDINRTLSELRKTQSTRRVTAITARPSLASPQSASPSLHTLATSLGAPTLDPSLESDIELSRLKSAIAAKRQEVTRLEEARDRQLSELQTKLAQLTAVYTTEHPSVAKVQQDIAALNHEPAQLINLKSDLRDLQTEYEARSDQADQQIRTLLALRDSAGPSEAVPVDPPLAAPPPPSSEARPNEADEFSTLRLRSELNQLESVLERANAARIELAVSDAAFKYRYTIIKPAQVPRDPIRPNLRLIIAAGFIGSLLLAFAGVVTKDLLSNRVLERWQVQRQLGLTILGTVRLG